MTPPLTKQHCVPCEGGVPPLESIRAAELLAELNHDWELVAGMVTKRFGFANFVKVMKFVNQVALIAESEGHHPDMLIEYRFVTFRLITHAIKGLSDNDFILAAKIQARYDTENQ